MKVRTGIALIFLVLALSLTTATLIQQNSQAPAWALTPTAATLQQPTPKSITVTWGNEIQVNTYTASHQESTSVCNRSDGSFVVVWESNGQDLSGYGIYAKIFDSTGSSTTGDIPVNTYTTNDQRGPSVCCRSDGSFVVAWTSYGQDAANTYGVYARIFDSTGVPLTPEIPVNTYTTNNQADPSVCCRSDDSFVVAWHGEGSGDSLGVYAKIFNSAGVGTTGDILVNTYTTNDQMAPSVCCRPDDSFVVAWYGAGSGDFLGVYARIFNSAGVGTTGDILVNTETWDIQWFPSVCCRSDGSFVVAWESSGQDSADTFGVYAKIFDSGGSNTTGDIQVNSYTASDQRNPSVRCRSDGSFVVAWHSLGQDAAGGYGVYAKLFNSKGHSMTGDIQVNTYTASSQAYPSVCCRSDGSFVVAWESYGQDAAGTYGVYFRVGSPAALPIAVFSLVAVLSLMQSASGSSLPLLVGGGLVLAVVVVGVLGFWLWKRRA